VAAGPDLRRRLVLTHGGSQRVGRRDGIVTLEDGLAYCSRAEDTGYAVAGVAGVIAVHNELCYDNDDLAITGF
jgi:hypothetical protein